VIYESVDPATGTLLAREKAIDARALERTLARAAAAFHSWRATPIEQRAHAFQKLAELLLNHADTLADLATSEMGKTLRAAHLEVEKCAATCRTLAALAPGALAPERRDGFGAHDRVRFEPLGVVLAVMPWNFPYWQPLRFAIPGLLAGNVGLFKPAPRTASTMRALAGLFLEAGFPEGVFQAVLADNDQVARIIADPRVAALTFTGSGASGRQLAALAGGALKRSVLELGGSDAFIVCADADLSLAVPAAVEARLVCHGQSCIAAKRFFIEAPVYDAFVSAFVARMGAIRMGSPRDAATDLGPLASREQATRLDRQVSATLEAGARLLVGGRKAGDDSAYYPATVLADVPWTSPAATEELFGPVAPVFRVADRGEAVARTNDSVFGLAASVWTRSRETAQKYAEELAVGTVFVNGQVVSDARYPFGGVKESGYGRELGLEGLRELVNVKTVRMSF